MDDWAPITRLIPIVLLFIYFALSKAKRNRKKGGNEPPRRVRRARTDSQKFKRDYEPIEPK
jgi:hypothetical protein